MPLLCSILCISGTTSKGRIIDKMVYITTTEFGTFKEDNEDFYFTVCLEYFYEVPAYVDLIIKQSNGSTYEKITEKNNFFVYEDNPVTFQDCIDAHTIGKRGLDITFSLINNYYQTSMFELTFHIGSYASSKHDAIKEKEISVPYKWQVYKNKVYEQRDYFKFENISETLLCDTYYRLDISSYSFIYESEKYTYTSASMYIYNYPECLQSLDPLRLGFIQIALNLTYKDGKMLVSYKYQFYVHPKTYQISLLSKTDYVPTKYFYLPVNHKEDLEGMKINFKFNEVGFTRQSFAFCSYFAGGNNLLGECSDSDYCVVGGVQ